MKQIVMFMASFAVALSLYAAFTDLDSAQYYGKINIPKTLKAIDANFEMVAAQSDTNVTTTATLYTPDFTGQVLVGGAGTGTNAIWIAKGVTTNDWVQVTP